MRWGDAQEDIYALPHDPYETEAGQRVRSLEVIQDALEMVSPEHLFGLMIHPLSYDNNVMFEAGVSKADHIHALFDEIESHGLTSVTLSETCEHDQSDNPCRESR